MYIVSLYACAFLYLHMQINRIAVCDLHCEIIHIYMLTYLKTEFYFFKTSLFLKK